MIERLLTPGSITELTTRPHVFGKRALYAYFPLGPRSLSVVAAQTDEDLQTEPKKSALRWCG